MKSERRSDCGPYLPNDAELNAASYRGNPPDETADKCVVPLEDASQAVFEMSAQRGRRRLSVARLSIVENPSVLFEERQMPVSLGRLSNV